MGRERRMCEKEDVEGCMEKEFDTYIHTPTHLHTITPSHQPLRLTCTNGRGILSMITVGVAPVAMVTLKYAVLSPITLHMVQPYLC